MENTESQHLIIAEMLSISSAIDEVVLEYKMKLPLLTLKTLPIFISIPDNKSEPINIIKNAANLYKELFKKLKNAN